MELSISLELLLLITALSGVTLQFCSYKISENKEGYLECDQPAENVTSIFVPEGNPIKKIKKGLFVPFIKLTSIYIGQAEIEEIEPGSFDGLHLQALQLNNNNIKMIKNGTFNSLATVTMLETTFNQLESIEADTFLGMESLVWLSLSANQIKYIDEKAFNGLGKLQNLFISSNKLYKLDVKTFNPLASLTILELAQNNLHNFELGIFSHQKNLEKLTLSNNKLEELPDNLFYNLTALTALDLTRNNIRTLQGDLFRGMENLKTLQFEFNNVSHLNPKDVLTHLPQLKEVVLVNNPWKCDELRKLKIHLLERGVFIPIFVPVVDKLNVDGIACNE